MIGAGFTVIPIFVTCTHVAMSNNGNAPRFLLSGVVDLPSMWTVKPFS